MAINFVTGKPRQGKTLWTICWVKQMAEKLNRPVYYCNIPEVTIEGWTEISHPDKWMTEVPNDAIVIVDELQDFWGMASTGAKVPHAILELSKHGKRGIDFFFITQHPSLVHTTPRALAQTHYHVIRAFGTESCTIHMFSGGMETQPDKAKKKAEMILFKYPKKVFGKKDKAGNWIEKPWYKSADVHNVQRKLPWKLIALPVMVLIAGASIWGSWHLLGSSVDKAKGAAGGDVVGAIAPGANAVATAPSARAGQQQPRMTREEWFALYKPRMADFPNTAPRYDEITKPVHAPYPAACIAMKDKCECYSQQGTKLPATGADVCQQIVANGYFVEWALPEPKAPAPMPERTEAPRARLVSAPAPGAAPVQTEDAEFEQWKRERAQLQQHSQLALKGAAQRAQVAQR